MTLQMIVASWPLGLAVTDRAGIDAWIERLAGWQQKAIREAKHRSGWALPEEAYEGAAAAFLRGVLDLGSHPGLARALEAFAARIAPLGAMKSLAQVTLRLTVPGVPDLYQGTEFWDESLVDPDNRRPVDYQARQAALAAPDEAAALLDGWPSGRAKQVLIHRLLLARNQSPALFRQGRHLPLRPEGSHAAGVLAFLRQDGDETLLVAVPIRALPLFGPAQQSLALAEGAWGDTRLSLPAALAGRAWRCLLSGAELPAAASLPLRGPWPVMALRAA